jgi:hypothetical protein
MNFILQWIDIIWLLLAGLVLHKGQRLPALAAILACMVMMRLMIELMESAGYPRGIIGFVSIPVAVRGMAVYSFFYVAYLLYAYSLRSTGAIFLATSIAIFFAAAFTFALVMVV